MQLIKKMFQISETQSYKIAEIFSKKNILINIHDPYMNRLILIKVKILRLLIGKIFQRIQVLILRYLMIFIKKRQIFKSLKNSKKLLVSILGPK